MRVFLSSEHGAYELTPVNKRLARQLERETGSESVLFQTDWDFPGLAQSLGWNIIKAHKRNCADTHGTDGTVTCAGCGLGASHFIAKAQAWLDKRIDSVLRADCEAYFERR